MLRSQLYDLDLLAFRLAVMAERINYYFLGYLMPRNQDLSPVSLSSDLNLENTYSVATCNKIKALLLR
jgi:hypothetical protein